MRHAPPAVYETIPRRTVNDFGIPHLGWLAARTMCEVPTFSDTNTTVLTAAAQGLTLQETGTIISAAPSTVARRRRKIQDVLWAVNMPHAVRISIEAGRLPFDILPGKPTEGRPIGDEYHALHLLTSGHSAGQAAALMGISPGRVHDHMRYVYAHLGLQGDNELHITAAPLRAYEETLLTPIDLIPTAAYSQSSATIQL